MIQNFFRIIFSVLFLLIVFPASIHAENSIIQKELHILNRLGYGPRPGDIEKLNAIGIDKYIKDQLSPENIQIPVELTSRLDNLKTLHMSSEEIFKEYGPEKKKRSQRLTVSTRKANRERAPIIINEAVQTRLMLALESPQQLQEVMVDFWFNHFNIFSGKELDHLLVGAFEQEAIRPYALGHFRDLLEATAKHPAMLCYLDNWKSSVPDNIGAHGQFKGLNENYARELMEFHTLGVDGGYTQNDVVALARILTGWTLRQPNAKSDTFGFYFDSRRHDYGKKIFLGEEIQGEGQQEGEIALDILARHPSTARHICYKLAQNFVNDDPDPGLVKKLSEKFLETDGDIRAVLDTLFHSAQFWDEKNFDAKFKTPYRFIVSTIRASGRSVENYKPIKGALIQFGMPLYGCLTPDGYKDTQTAWLNPEGMLRRVSFVTAFANGNIKIDNSNQPLDASQLLKTLGNEISENTRKMLAKSPERLRAALILGGPDFMKH